MNPIPSMQSTLLETYQLMVDILQAQTQAVTLVNTITTNENPGQDDITTANSQRQTIIDKISSLRQRLSTLQNGVNNGAALAAFQAQFRQLSSGLETINNQMVTAQGLIERRQAAIDARTEEATAQEQSPQGPQEPSPPAT